MQTTTQKRTEYARICGDSGWQAVREGLKKLSRLAAAHTEG